MTSKSTKRTWTVEGVDAEAASMAKAAAEAAGMSVSDWLSKVILESTRPDRGAGSGGRVPGLAADSAGPRGAGAEAHDDEDAKMDREADRARESLEQFLQAVIDDASGRPQVMEEPELGEAISGFAPSGDLPHGRAPSEVEINRESVVLPQGAVVFQSARAAGARDRGPAAPKPAGVQDGAERRDSPPGPAGRVPAEERPSTSDTEIISPLIARDSDFAELDPRQARTPAAMADAAADVGLVGLSAREPAAPAETDAPAKDDEAPPDWDQSEIVDDWTLRPETRTDSLDLAGEEPVLPPGLGAGAAAAEPEAEATADPLAGRPAPSDEAEPAAGADKRREAERDGDATAAALDADWPQQAPPVAAPTADLTWWERLEAEQERSARPDEPPAEGDLEASDLAVVRAMVAGEDRLEPARRPIVRWLMLFLLLALLVGAGLAVWLYPQELREVRQQIGAFIAGEELTAERAAAPDAAPEEAATGDAAAGRAALGEIRAVPEGESDTPAGRLPPEGAGGARSPDAAEEPPADAAAPASTDRAQPAPVDGNETAPPVAESPRQAAPAPGADTPPPPGPPEQNVAWYAQAAAAGNPAAQTVLARLYADGVGVGQDARKAAGWYRLAAAAGVADAQYALGELYEAGRGVSKDDVEAVVWYELAARQEHAQAQYRLGLASRQGVGTPINFAAARRWFERAARQGVPAAKYQLGLMYRDGLGVAADNALAFRWLSEAGQAGHRPAIQALRELMPKISGEDLLSAGEEIRREHDAPTPTQADGGATAPAPNSVEPAPALPEVADSGPAQPDVAEPAPEQPDVAEPTGAPEAQVVRPPEPPTGDVVDDAIIGPAMPASQPPPSQPSPPQIAVEDGRGPNGSRGKTIVIADRALVTDIQRALRRLKLMAGSADGRLTDETQQAIATYQRIAGLEPDGVPTPALRDHLRKVLAGARGD